MSLELKDRLASVRKAAGLTQAQLGELLGVSRQAVSKWETGQTAPDAATIAALCQALQVSADYVLLGKEPEECTDEESSFQPPDVCPCCGRPVSGTLCSVCGYPLPTRPPQGPRYALLLTRAPNVPDRDSPALVRYCGMTEEEAVNAILRIQRHPCSPVLLRRGLTDGAAGWIASRLNRSIFNLRIVEDCGEDSAALPEKPSATNLPGQSGSLTFAGVVGAVIVALLILSFL